MGSKGIKKGGLVLLGLFFFNLFLLFLRFLQNAVQTGIVWVGRQCKSSFFYYERLLEWLVVN